MMRAMILAVPIALIVSGCGATAASSAGGTRAFNVSEFDSVELRGSDNVRVIHGASASVVATGPANILDRLDIHVEGKSLKIGRKLQWAMGWSEQEHALVTVTTPVLRAAAVAGSGNMDVDTARAEQFAGSVAGSGDLGIARIDARSVRFDVAGSGNLRAEGRTGTAKLSIAGSGDIDAQRVISDTADISIAGSGNAHIGARSAATISIVGSGDADVTGTDKCTVRKLGSGEARCTR